jgi:hypothetical protein
MGGVEGDGSDMGASSRPLVMPTHCAQVGSNGCVHRTTCGDTTLDPIVPTAYGGDALDAAELAFAPPSSVGDADAGDT